MKKRAVLTVMLVLFAFLPQVVAGGVGEAPAPREVLSPGSGDDGKITNIATWSIRGGAVVAGSTEGFSFLDPGVTLSWKFSLSDVSGNLLLALLYIPTFIYTGADSWKVDLTDPTMTTTTLATGTSTPYDEDSTFGLFRFDVQVLMAGLGASVNGFYTVTIENTGTSDFGVYGAAVVVVFGDDAKPETYVWVNDGCEYIWDATTLTTFPDIGQPGDFGVGLPKTRLHTVVGGGNDAPDDEVYFDGHLLATDAFDSSQGHYFDVDSFYVRPYLGPGVHDASFYGGDDAIFVYAVVLVYVPIQLPAYPEPFIEWHNPTFIVGGTHPHGPYNWQAWTVDVLGSIGVAARLGREATGFVAHQRVDDDVADYDPGTGDVTVYWPMIPLDVISVGGPPVNIFALHYEQFGGCPFYMAGLPGSPHIHSDLSGSDYGFAGGPGGYDHAVIALHYDVPPDRFVLVVYGVTGRGSQAACRVLQFYDNYQMIMQGRAVILRWDDTNTDNLVGPGDSIALEEVWFG